MGRKTLNVALALALCVVSITGCAQKPETANSGEAIKKAATLESVDAQAKYLVKEANAFVSSQQFDDAIKVAKHVLSDLDKDSVEAKSIIEKAQAELKALAQKKADEIKAKMKKSLGQ